MNPRTGVCSARRAEWRGQILYFAIKALIKAAADLSSELIRESVLRSEGGFLRALRGIEPALSRATGRQETSRFVLEERRASSTGNRDRELRGAARKHINQPAVHSRLEQAALD